MRKIFQYILMAVAVVATASCSNELDEALQPAGNGTLQFVVSDFPAFGENPETRAIGTQDPGKTAWAKDDQIIITLTSQKYGKQVATLIYDGSLWNLGSSLLYLENEKPTVSAIYSPCHEVTGNTKELKTGMLYGMTEYLVASDCQVVNNTISISFDGVTRDYSRLRIAALADQELSVTTTGFTPAGATTVATAPTSYTLTTDNNGNAYLYGIFEKGATVTVKHGTVTLAEFTFSEDKNFSNGTEQGKSYALDARPVIDLSQYADGATVNITEDSRIIGDGTEFNVTLNIAADATVIFEVGTSGVKLGGSITVADGKTLTLLATGNAEHIVKGGISLGNSANVIIEGDLTQENNKLTVTSSGGNAGIGANNGVTAGDITIRNARVDATGSCSSDSNLSGAGIGTAKASMGNILIENSIVTAAGGYDAVNSVNDDYSHAAAIGMGSFGVTMGNITLINSEITASNNGDGYASVIGAGSCFYKMGEHNNIGNMGDIIITNTELNLSMAESTYSYYASMIGPGRGNNQNYVNMGKIIFTDVTQAELDEMIKLWSIPSDFNEYGAYVLGRGFDGVKYNIGDFGGVWVSDGNGGTVPIDDENGYCDLE